MERIWKEGLKVTMGPSLWSSGYESVNRLLRYLQIRGGNSECSKIGYLWTLYKFCQFSGTDPDSLLRLGKGVLESMIAEFGELIASPQRRFRHANRCLVALKAFFRENGFRRETGTELLIETFKLSPRSRRRPQYIPTVQEALKMAETWGRGSRNYALILLMLSTGLRNSTVRALRFVDIRTELPNASNLCISINEKMKEVVPAACKGRIPYFVLTHELATEAIRAYILLREEKHGKTPDSAPLFPSDYNQISREARNLKIMSLNELGYVVKDAARRAGMKEWRYVTPHCLRKTYESFMRNQPGDVRLDSKDQLFLMGHILGGSEDPYYDWSKVEEMRTKYSKMVLDPSARTGNGNKKKQEIVTEEDLESWMLKEEGWTICTVLPSGRIVIERNL